MKKLFVIGSLAVLVVAFASFDAGPAKTIPNDAFNDSLEKDRSKYIALVNESIKGKEKMPVDSVFYNLKVLGGFPAENLPFAMTKWSIGLGVSCGHCHNTNDWTSDEKKEKIIARKMVKLGTLVNTELKNIEGLSIRPIVNCITCHRGELKPALNMPKN